MSAVDAPEPAIDYLRRDYAGLRGLLLDRLALVMPDWRDRNPAELAVALVELFAYAGDHLAYAQDAVSAEAYLGTARRRVSVARHARLLDYPMHQGAAARTWLVVEADAPSRLPAGTEVRDADGDVVFHTLHERDVRPARAWIDFHTGGAAEPHLPRGATRASLRGRPGVLGLHRGDVLVLEEVRGGDGREDGADPRRRWPVRLVEEPVEGPEGRVTVRWGEEDALPFRLSLRRFPEKRWSEEERCFTRVGAAVARGDVVLAEHGRLVGPEPLVPEAVPADGRYRPALPGTGLAFAEPYIDANADANADATARVRPAAEALEVRPQHALPRLHLVDQRDVGWTARRDLLGSDRFAQDVTVEVEDDGRIRMRFGDDVHGRRPTPGTRFRATWRLGGGRVGNVGADVLTHLDTPAEGLRVRNPLPARGGAEPETVEQVRQWAPQAFRTQERAVTDADYAALAERDPRVRRAAATRRWTGSWYTEFVTVARRGGKPVDTAFRREMSEFLERFRMAGTDVEVVAPVTVALHIELRVHLVPGHFQTAVEQALRTRFSRYPGGVFDPDAFAFGQPVYLSDVVAAAMAVDGVARVATPPTRFGRLGRPAAGEIDAGRIAMEPLEIARCDSDRAHPEHGHIAFTLSGGRRR